MGAGGQGIGSRRGGARDEERATRSDRGVLHRMLLSRAKKVHVTCEQKQKNEGAANPRVPLCGSFPKVTLGFVAGCRNGLSLPATHPRARRDEVKGRGLPPPAPHPRVSGQHLLALSKGSVPTTGYDMPFRCPKRLCEGMQHTASWSVAECSRMSHSCMSIRGLLRSF